MANNTNIPRLADTPATPDQAQSGGTPSLGALALAWRANHPNTGPSVTGNIASLIDPRKVYLAKDMGSTDGLNEYEKDFATKSLEENVAKYGNQAYGIANNILGTASGDFGKSQVDRTVGEAAGDIATGLSLGTLDFGLQAGQFLTNLSPLGIADRAFGTHLTEPLNKMWASARGANQQLMHSLYSDVKNHGEEIKEYKNQLDEARHLREQEEAIANGESTISAVTSRIAKDAYTSIGNALSTPTALLDMPVELLESILSMKALGKIGLGVAKGATALTNALVDRTAARAGVAAAERAGVAGRGAVAEGSPEFMGPPRPLRTPAEQSPDFVGPRIAAEQRADFVGPRPMAEQRADFVGPRRAPAAAEATEVAGNTATRTAAQAAEGTAAEAVANESEGWLAKVGKGFWNKKTEMAHVGIQEGGAGASTAYDTVQKMSTDELEQSSEMYRDKKKKYLAQGLSEEEASSRAKEEVAQAAAFDSGVLQAMIAAPAGRLMPDNMIKSPFKTFFSGSNYLNNVKKETGEEMLEGLGQLGYNVGAKNTYNNDQDLAKDMGRSIGEGGIAAFVGTGEMGAPRAALRGIGKGIGAAWNHHVEAKEQKNIKTNLNTINTNSEAISQAANNLATNPTSEANTGSGISVSSEDAQNALHKVSSAGSATLSADEANEINTAMGGESVRENDNKYAALSGLASFLQEQLKPENVHNQEGIRVLNQVRTFNKLYDSLFEAQPIDSVISQVSDEETKKKIKDSYDAYHQLSQSKVFTNLQKTAMAHAAQIVGANQDISKIISNNKLSAEEKSKLIDETLNAYEFLVQNSLASDADLAKARQFVEAAQNSGVNLNEATTTSFLDEINRQEQFNTAMRQQATAETNLNEKVAQTTGVTADEVAKFRAGKDIDTVAYQKLSQFYNSDDTNRLSLHSTMSKMRGQLKNNDKLGAKQTLIDYMNYIQSQVNKLNAYRTSLAAYENEINDATANNKSYSDIRAKAVQYDTYNPESRTWFPSDKGIYAGDPALGNTLVDETEMLVKDFQLIKNTFFKGIRGMSLKDYKPNEGISNQHIRDYYDRYTAKNRSKSGHRAADEQTMREMQQQQQNNNANANQTQQSNTNQNQAPVETQSQADIQNQNTAPEPDITAPNQSQNNTNNQTTEQNQKPKPDILADDSVFNPDEAQNNNSNQNTTPVDNNTKPADNTTNNTEPKPQRDYLNIGNDSLGGFLSRLYNGAKHPITSAIESALSQNNFSESGAVIVQKLHRCVQEYNKANPNSQISAKEEQSLVRATKHYFNEKNKQKIKASKENQAKPVEQNNSKPQENVNTSPNVNNNTNTNNNSTSQNQQNTNTQDNSIQENSTNPTETQNVSENNTVNEKPVETNQKVEENTKPTKETNTNTVNEITEEPILGESSDINQSQETSFLDPIRKTLTKVKNRLYRFTNKSFMPYKDLIKHFQDELNNPESKFSKEDLTKILNALDGNDPNSFINVFRQNLKKQIQPDVTINSEAEAYFPVAEDSPFYNIHHKNGKTITSKVTYSEVLSVLRDPAKLARVSEDELERLYNIFPTLMLMEVNGKGEITLNNDMVVNMALDAIGVMNSNKNGSGADWSQIAQSLDMDLSDILSIRDANGNSVGARFLEAVSKGAIVAPLFDSLSRNISKSLGLNFNLNHVSLAARQNTSKVLADIVLRSIADQYTSGTATNKPFIYSKFDVGNGIEVLWENTPKGKENNNKTIFNSLENPEALNSFLHNDREGEIGDIVVSGKEKEPAKTTQTKYLHTGIELTTKAKNALTNYEKCKYRIDEDMADIYESLSNETGNGLISLYGEDVSDAENMDEEDLISKNSANSLIINAFAKFKGYQAQMQEVAQAENVPLSKVFKRFKYAFTTVNRIQELESYGPTANKLMREVLLSTWNTMDLNNTDHMEDLGRAIIQNFGGKLNNNNFKKATNVAWEKLWETVTTKPENFSNLMMLATNPKAVTTTVVKNAQEELATFMNNKTNPEFAAIKLSSVDQNFMGLHAMQTLARVAQAKIHGQDKVDVSIYCEADGTTNGTINTQFLMTSFIEAPEPVMNQNHKATDPAKHTIDLCYKGNMRIGDLSGRSAGEVKSEITGAKDVYALAGENAEKAIKKHVELFTNGNNYTHEAADKYAKQKRPEVLPYQYYRAVNTLFRFSGLTANITTSLEDCITRNFMKSPCTKGMYGAGLKSIINTFLYGDRNVPGVIHQMHVMRSKAMKAQAKAKREGKEFTAVDAARAMFGGKEETKLWTDQEYLNALNEYCNALNIVTQNAFVSYKDQYEKQHAFCKPIYIFNNERNSYSVDGWHYHKQFTVNTFLNQEAQDGSNSATLKLSDANIENIFNAIHDVYGDTIAQTVTNTIRGANVIGTQSNLLQFAKQSTLLSNIVALAKIAKIIPNNSFGKPDLVDFNDKASPISNVLNSDTAAFPIGYDEHHSREELTGGSLNNTRDFARYSDKVSNPMFNFISSRASEYDFTYLGNPGVRLLPNMAIAFGDGDMMQTAMNSDFLEKIGYATTLIFDGGNAAVGMMHNYGENINRIQFETDMRNIMEPVLTKLATQYAYLTNQIESSEDNSVKQACQLMANALKYISNYKDNFDANGRNHRANSPKYLDALIENLVATYSGDTSKRYDFIEWFESNHRDAITPKNAKGMYIKPVITREDLSYNNFSMKNLRKKVKQQCYKQIEAALGSKAMEKYVPSAEDRASYNVTEAAFRAYQITLNSDLEKHQSYNEMQRHLLKDCVDAMFGSYDAVHEEYIPGREISDYSNATYVANNLKYSLGNLVEEIGNTTANISAIQAAKFLMGGTYDHMASHDAPYTHIPTQESFAKFLEQMHLEFKDKGTTINSLWDQARVIFDPNNIEDDPYRDKEQVLGDALRDLTHLIQAKCKYTNPNLDAESSRVVEELNKPKPIDKNSVKTMSVTDYLKENKAYHSVSSMLHSLFNATALDGVNKHTKIRYFTSGKLLLDTSNGYHANVAAARKAAINSLKQIYKQDMQQRIANEKNEDQKTALEANLQSTLAYIDNKASQDNIENGDITPIQFYDPNTNTIYIVPTNPSGINSKSEADKNLNIRLPHEIMHSIADKFINFYWKDLRHITPSGQLTAEASRIAKKDNLQSRAFKRKTYALKALWRMNKLKQEFDAIDHKLFESARRTNPQLDIYLSHMEAGTWANNPAKALQEFIASVGSMSDQQIAELDQIFKSKSPDSLRDLVTKTNKDYSSKTVKAIFDAVKKAFTDFLAAIFNTTKSDPSLRDVIQSNLTIMSAVSEFNHKERNTSSAQRLAETVSEPTEQTSFLDETFDQATDSRTSVDATSGSVDITNNPSSETSLDRLANSLVRAIKARFSMHNNPIERSMSDHDTVERLKSQKENLLADVEYIHNTTGANLDSTINNVITPLQNLGFNTGDPKTFATVVHALSLLQSLKAPVITDVNLAVKKVLDKLTPEALCKDPKNADELAKAQSLVDFIFNTDNQGITTEQITPVIVALSQTDNTFRDFLSKLDNTKTKHTDEYLSFDKFFDSALDKAAAQFNRLQHKNSSTMSKAFDQMIGQMARDERNLNKINFAENALNKVENAISRGIVLAGRSALRAIGKDENLNLQDFAVSVENAFNRNKYIPHWFNEVIHDILATNPESYERYAAYSKAKTTVQQTRENARNKTPLILKRKLKSVTQEQWEGFTRTIGNTGLSSLFIKNSTKNLSSLLRSQSQIKDSIKQLEDYIHDDYRKEKCKQLANYMMTGKAGKMLLVNPVAIAKSLGSTNSRTSVDKSEITACDRLTSLYAVQMLSEKERTGLADLLDKEPAGMKHLLAVVKNQYKEGVDKANGANRGINNWRKGVHANAYNSAAHYKVAPLADKEQMQRMGYDLISTYKGSNLEHGKLGVYYSKISSTNIMNPGAIQNTTSTANGINTSSGYSLAPNAGRISDQKTVQSIIANMDRYQSKNDEDLIPIFDGGNNIVAFERTLNPKLLKNNKYVKPENDFAKLLGIQEGRNIEEKLISEFNKEIVNLVHKTWLNEDGRYKEEDFVDLFKEQDPVIKNIVNLMPKDVKQQIKDVYGGNHFYVLRSEVNDVIGYHSASITDSWTGESRLPEPVQKAIVGICEGIMGKNAFRYLKTVETAEQNVVKAAKNAIIVRSLIVPTMNLAANVIQLWIEGVPLSTIAKEMPKVTKELQQYTKIQTQLLILNQELMGETNASAKEKISKKIDFLTKAQKDLSISYLLEQKEFSSIADLGDTGRELDYAEGALGDQILAHIDKLSNNNIVRSITHYAMVAPDTSLYKFLEKTNQYGDFLGRAILFKELTENRGWTKEQAHLKVKDEFVDYTRMPGRGRDFLERSGLLWFYNFKLRMMKVAAANLKEHPLRSLALTYGGLNTPMSDSLLGKLPVLSYSMGPAMMLSAFSCNPWVMLLGLLF